MILAFLVCVGVAIGFLVMGIKIRKSDKPAGYYTFLKKPEVDNIKKYADSDYVKSYYYTMKVGVNANDLEKASVTSNSDNNNEQQDENRPEKK